jgi:hypothetical protein
VVGRLSPIWLSVHQREAKAHFRSERCWTCYPPTAASPAEVPMGWTAPGVDYGSLEQSIHQVIAKLLAEHRAATGKRAPPAGFALRSARGARSVRIHNATKGPDEEVQIRLGASRRWLPCRGWPCTTCRCRRPHRRRLIPRRHAAGSLSRSAQPTWTRRPERRPRDKATSRKSMPLPRSVASWAIFSPSSIGQTRSGCAYSGPCRTSPPRNRVVVPTRPLRSL